MSDASLVSFLQSELLLLSNEIKKKYPEIKGSIENIFQLIRKIKDDPDRPNAVEVFSQTEIILQPIVLACRTGNARVIAIAINCLQKLVIFRAFPRECISRIFGVLETAAEMNSDIQLKSLQCLSPLMANYNDIYGSELIRIFAIAFKLQESKTGMVNNATAAIIRQMIISLFERVGEEASDSSILISNLNISEGVPFPVEPTHAQDALLILSDVTCRLDDQKCTSLDLSKIDKPFALDLIESVLVNHGEVIRSHKFFSTLIQDRICPYLVESLKTSNEVKADFAKVCRHWRIIQLLITEFNDLFPDEVEIFITFGIRILRESNLIWECAMVLEVNKTIFQSEKLIEEIYLICEKNENPRIFKDMMDVMLDVVNKVLNSHPSDLDSQGQLIDSLLKSSILNQFDKATPPPISPIALLLLTYESFTSWFANLAGFLKLGCSEMNSLGFLTYKSFKAVNLNPKTLTIILDLILSVGIPLCKVMEQIFLEVCFNQSQLHTTTLEFFSRAMTIFSVLEFKIQLKCLMEILVSMALPQKLNEIKKSNLLVIKMILETGHGVGELLEESLMPLLRIIQTTEYLQIQKTKKQKVQGISPMVVIGSALDEDVLSKAIDAASSLTESSVIWSELAFTFLIQAYGKLIDEDLNHFITGNDERISSSLLLILTKLGRLLTINMFRFVQEEKCTEAWGLFMVQLEKLMQVRDTSIRQASVEIVSITVDLIIKTIPPNRMKTSQSQSQTSEMPCCENENLQMRILAPISKMSFSVPWIDIQRVLLESLLRYLHAFGDSLNESSWSLVWIVLEENLRIVRSESLSQSLTEGSDVSAIYQRVHDTVKMACGDFITSIPMVSLAPLIDLIAAVGEICLSGELNIPLNTVRYLWDISDFLCSKNYNGQVFDLWTRLLKHLVRLSLDSRPELRNSSVQTLLRTINMNGGALKGFPDRWACLFDEILFEFFRELRQAATSKIDAVENKSITLGFNHFSRDSEAKQWDETEATVMTGVSTLFLSHFKGIQYELPEFPRYWCQFLQVLKNYSLLEHGSVELTGVAVNCLSQLSIGLKEIKKELEISEFSMEIWKVWSKIGFEGFISSDKFKLCPFFTQDSLLKFLKMFPILFELCQIDLSWLKDSLQVLTGVLKCPTPTDQVRDTETPTEVQKFLIQQILDELIRRGQGKVLILNEISNWLSLANNSSGIATLTGTGMITMGYASLRSRQSTTSSSVSLKGTGVYDEARDKDKDLNSGIQLIKCNCSFIAMTSILLEKLPVIISAWKDYPELYEKESCLVPIFQSLGRLMKLKYKCPANTKTKTSSLWRTSSNTFISLCKDIFSSTQADLADLWSVILNELRGALNSAKEMFNRSLKIEEIEEDEKFDCQLIDLITDSVIPRALKDVKGINVTVKDEIIEESIDLILEIARITKFHRGEENFESVDDFLFPSGVKGLPVAVKEILAFSAYLALFKLSLSTNDQLVSTLTLKKLTIVLKLHLEAFQADRKILGNDFPFPRLRDLELHELLKGLLNLKGSDQLKEVYDLIVRCAEFGGGGRGCDGARMIVKDCRRVLLLLSDKQSIKISDSESEESESEEDNETVEFMDIEVPTLNTSISLLTPTISTETKSELIVKFPIKTKIQIPISSVNSKVPQSPLQLNFNSSPIVSPRRSVSQEFFDHLSHDLRIMEFFENDVDNK